MKHSNPYDTSVLDFDDDYDFDAEFDTEFDDAFENDLLLALSDDIDAVNQYLLSSGHNTTSSWSRANEVCWWNGDYDPQTPEPNVLDLL